MDLTGLILRDGQDAVASGMVLDDPSENIGRLLLNPENMPSPTSGLSFVPQAVLAVAPGRLPDAGTLVEVIGPIIDGVLYPHTITHHGMMSVPPPSDHVLGHEPTSSPQLQTALHELDRDGIVTSFWANLRSDIFWVAATDPARAEKRLSGVVTEQLRIVRSRWSADEIRAASDALISFPDPQGILLGFGQSHGEDHQMHMTADIREVTPEFAQAVTDIPDELLEVTVHIARYNPEHSFSPPESKP